MVKPGRFTLEEILSQPIVWEKSLSQISQLNLDNFPNGDRFDQVIFTGCGSTYYLSLWAARAAQHRRGWACLATPASELWLRPELWMKSSNVLLVAISRSGSTSETVAALKGFKKRERGRSIVITCYPNSELAKLSDCVISLPHAQEQSVAQTRSFTSMMLGVALIVEREIPEGLSEHLTKPLSAVIHDENELVSNIGTEVGFQRFFFLGSGSKYGLACEAMLKMKEMSLSYAEAYHFLEFRHGPMSMVDSTSLVVGLIGHNRSDRELDVLQDMQQLGAKVLAIGPVGHTQAVDHLDHFIPIHLNGFGTYGDVGYLPTLQKLAYERARANDLDPDQPAHLSAVVKLEI
jgi:glucosamine--fructose-6-phosphate aminotransferase (isomerizing)